MRNSVGKMKDRWQAWFTTMVKIVKFVLYIFYYPPKS